MLPQDSFSPGGHQLLHLPRAKVGVRDPLGAPTTCCTLWAVPIPEALQFTKDGGRKGGGQAGKPREGTGKVLGSRHSTWGGSMRDTGLNSAQVPWRPREPSCPWGLLWAGWSKDGGPPGRRAPNSPMNIYARKRQGTLAAACAPREHVQSTTHTTPFPGIMAQAERAPSGRWQRGQGLSDAGLGLPLGALHSTLCWDCSWKGWGSLGHPEKGLAALA